MLEVVTEVMGKSSAALTMFLGTMLTGGELDYSKSGFSISLQSGLLFSPRSISLPIFNHQLKMYFLPISFLGGACVMGHSRPRGL
jgi:hypothetical protein